ncbi:MAG: Abi family protein [Acaryochloris sp. SU_5_25]|nr:Abi family protein [Acaryochloris sp. SU_5_25]
MTEVKATFSKPALTIEQQVNLLASRGLKIENREAASHYLKFIGYYRLSAYCVPFQCNEKNTSRHRFKPDTSFKQILELYIFDRKLRLLVMDAIERIEVAIKAAISNVVSINHGSHWFLRQEFFAIKFNHASFLEKVKKDISTNQAEIFIQYYKNNYSDPELPPSWMVFEMLSLGTVSRIYKFLKTELKKEIASLFSVHYKILESWLHTLTYLRNLCAHHSRLWNRIFTIKPKILKECKAHIPQGDSFFAQAFIVASLLREISRDSHWEERLEHLLKEYSEIDASRMGFPKNWKSLPIWG